jgi:hypothetical protein
MKQESTAPAAFRHTGFDLMRLNAFNKMNQVSSAWAKWLIIASALALSFVLVNIGVTLSLDELGDEWF